MKVLVLGGTALSGPFIVQELIDREHDVTVYHRGKSESPFLPACTHVHGDRKDRETFEATLRDLEAEAVIDLFSANGTESDCVVRAFRGRIRSSVHISSGDVYRDIGTDELLTEDAPWREGLPYGGKLGEVSGVNYSFASATIRIPGGLCGKGSGVALLGVGFGVVAGRRGLAGFCPPEGGQTSRADGPCVLSI